MTEQTTPDLHVIKQRTPAQAELSLMHNIGRPQHFFKKVAPKQDVPLFGRNVDKQNVYYECACGAQADRYGTLL